MAAPENESITPEIVEESRVSVIQQQETAALDVQVSTAKAYPRSVQRFQADLEAWATLNEAVAMECFYTKPTGGERIIGASVRFAELVTAAYTNVTVDSRVIGEEDGYVIVEGTCRDMERNTAFRSQVRRSIIDKKGKRYQQSVVENTINAGMAIARRNAVFQVVPKALWNPIWEKARRVALGNAATFEKRRQETVAKLRALGVNMENVKHFLGGKEPKDIDADSLLVLALRMKAIENNEVSADDAFPAPVGPDKEISKKSVSKASKALDKAKSKPDEETEIDPNTGEVIPDDFGLEGE